MKWMCDKLTYKPIRILHIVGLMNMGGIENFLMNVYRNIDRNKIQFDFLVTREEKGTFDEEIMNLGGKIYNIPKMETVGYNKYSKILYEFFKSHSEYKIVHCHRDSLCAIYLKQAQKAGINVRIAHSHTTSIIEEKNLKGYIKLIIKKVSKIFIKNYATDFFACSKEAGLWLFGSKIANEKLVIIRNGIDLRKYKYDKHIDSDIRSELGITENTFLIGHIGRFDLPKNHKFIVETIRELNKKIDDYKVCLVGDGILKNDISKIVKNYGLDDKFLFLEARNDVNKLMMAFDLFLFPSLFEGLGIVLIEAQATGLKCLISDTIPKEADMNLGLIKSLSLNKMKTWIELIVKEYQSKIINYKSHNRIIKERNDKLNHYDVHIIKNILESIYQNKIMEMSKIYEKTQIK